MKKIFVACILCLTILSFGDIPRFQQVHPHLYRGGQPTDYEDYKELKALGVKTILNLRETRSDVEWEFEIANEIGLNFIHVPISTVLPTSPSDIRRVLKIINTRENQPVFLHCRHGADRTGITIGLYRFYFDGWSAQEGYDEMVTHGFKQYLVGLSGFYWMYTGPKGLY